jgi:hypothetical protein
MPQDRSRPAGLVPAQWMMNSPERSCGDFRDQPRANRRYADPVVRADRTQGRRFFRQIRAKGTEYVLVIQFPEALRSEATLLKDGYFGSFKITHP